MLLSVMMGVMYLLLGFLMLVLVYAIVCGVNEIFLKPRKVDKIEEFVKKKYLKYSRVDCGDNNALFISNSGDIIFNEEEKIHIRDIKKIQFITNMVETKSSGSSAIIPIGGVLIPVKTGSAKVTESTNIKILFTVDNFYDPIITIEFGKSIEGAEKLMYIIKNYDNLKK